MKRLISLLIKTQSQNKNIGYYRMIILNRQSNQKRIQVSGQLSIMQMTNSAEHEKGHEYSRFAHYKRSFGLLTEVKNAAD